MSRYPRGEGWPSMSRWKNVLKIGIANAVVPLYPSGGVLYGQAGSGLVVGDCCNAILASPFKSPGFCWGNRLSINVSIAFSGIHLRAGIYQDNGDHYPGRLIFDSGAINPNTVGYWDVSAINWAFRDDHVFWSAGWIAQSAVGSYVACYPRSYGFNLIGGGDTMRPPEAHIDQSEFCGWAYPLLWSASTPLPDPYPSGAMVIDVPYAPVYYLRTV